MKRFVFLISFICLCTIPFRCCAADYQSVENLKSRIAADEGVISLCGSSLIMKGHYAEAATYCFVNDYLRYQAFLDLADGGLIRLDDVYFSYDEHVLERLVDENNYVITWADSMAADIVPNGATLREAADLCYCYILDNYVYESDTYAETPRYQGAYNTLKDGKGNCSGLAHLYRALVECIPFDADSNNVNFNCGTKYHTVSMVYSTDHCWAAINDAECGRLHYDLSYGLKERRRWQAVPKDIFRTMDGHVIVRIFA